MIYQDYGYEVITEILEMSLGALSKRKKAYEQGGLAGFRPQHKGRQSYLTPYEREAVLQWLQTVAIWELSELESHLAETYDVVYESKQSYYDLLTAVDLSWKKTSKVNPKTDAQAVTAKKPPSNDYRGESKAGGLRVLFVAECHLLNGDLQGYVLGAHRGAGEVPIVNGRERQTYYGALDLLSKRLLVQTHAKGNTTGTIEYLNFLQTQWPEQRFLVLWNGASYHRSRSDRPFLLKSMRV